MFETSPNSVDNLVHNFVQNFGLKIVAVDSAKAQKVKYITYIDRAQKTKKNLSRISDKARDIVTQSNLDFSDARNIQLFIKKQTNFFDKFYAGSVPLLGPHLRNINRKITQKVSKLRLQNRYEECKKHTANDCSVVTSEADILKKRFGGDAYNDNCREELLKGSSASPVSEEEHSCEISSRQNRKDDVKTVTRISKIPLPSPKRQYGSSDVPVNRDNTKYLAKEIVEKKHKDKDFWWIHKRKAVIGACNLTASVARFTQQETRSNEKYLELNIKDLDFIRQNVRITLYIAQKDVDINNFKISASRRQQVLLLCKQAILSSIEPSDKAFVVYEEKLSELIHNHLTHGCKYHFSFPSVSEDYYSALLVLSHWAELLVRHPNTILMRTIGCALGCSPRKILVLSYPEDDSE